MTNFVEYTVSDGKVTITKYKGTDTEVVIPPEIDGNPVTNIGMDAFWCCTSLTNVMIPKNVTSIGAWAFCDCISLTSVTIPDSVTSIGDYAFCDCNSLKDVWFSGTEEQWQQIKIGSYNRVLHKAKKHFKNA